MSFYFILLHASFAFTSLRLRQTQKQKLLVGKEIMCSEAQVPTHNGFQKKETFYLLN